MKFQVIVDKIEKKILRDYVFAAPCSTIL